MYRLAGCRVLRLELQEGGLTIHYKEGRAVVLSSIYCSEAWITGCDMLTSQTATFTT